MANVDVHPSPLPPVGKGLHNDHAYDEEEPAHKPMSAAKYAATRITTLKPAMDKAPNPFKLLGMLNTQQWMFFLVAFFGWTWDAFDFFTVSLTVSDLAEDFGKSNSDITWGITLVLMFRSVGSTIFGIASDRYGRKWYVETSIVCVSTRLFIPGPSSSTTSSSLY